MQLLQHDGLGDWQEFNRAGPKYQAVTATDIQRVAKAYFTKENRSVAVYTRKVEESAPADPELAHLKPDQRSRIQSLTAKLKAEKDLDGLKQAQSQLQAHLGDVPSDEKPFFEIYARKLQERIHELEMEKK
jgi:hypothetical protein